jgi:hypothetical protein
MLLLLVLGGYLFWMVTTASSGSTRTGAGSDFGTSWKPRIYNFEE